MADYTPSDKDREFVEQSSIAFANYMRSERDFSQAGSYIDEIVSKLSKDEKGSKLRLFRVTADPLHPYAVSDGFIPFDDDFIFNAVYPIEHEGQVVISNPLPVRLSVYRSVLREMEEKRREVYEKTIEELGQKELWPDALTEPQAKAA